jgi:hypothetical protein
MPRLRRATLHLLDEHSLQAESMVVTAWPGHDGRPGFRLREDGTKVLSPGHGIGSNYWDLLPFGHRDAYATILAHDTLRTMAELERIVAEHPEWEVAGPPDPRLEPGVLTAISETVRRTVRSSFWNPTTRRFVACVDVDGHAHDYGFTFVNLEAIHYGIASPEQSVAILAWLDGLRVVDGDTATGPDVYHWRFAPRATTRRNVDWYGWYWHSPESIPWGGQVQDGGAVLGFSYFDVMARLAVRGPDDAWRRLRSILDWFAEVQDAGGYRAYYDGSRAGTLQGGGTAGGLGMDQEFFESALVPQVMIDGFLGFRPRPDGFSLDPRIPEDWSSLVVDGVRFHDHVLRIEVTGLDVQIRSREEPTRPLTVRVRGEETRWEGGRTLRIVGG